MSTEPDPIINDPFGAPLGGEALRTATIRGSFVTAAVLIVKIAVQFISQLVLARFLFPDDFGLFAMAGPVFGFVQVFADIGLGQAVVQRTHLVHARISALFWVNLALSCGLAIFLTMVSPFVARIFNEPRLVAIMFSLSVLIPISAIGIIPQALLSRRMRFGLIAKFDLFSTLASVMVTLILASHGWSYWSLVAGQAAFTVVNVTLNSLSCGWHPSFPTFNKDAWADLQFGGNLTGANLATYATTSADNVIVGVTSGAVALGLYDRSYRLAVQPLNQITAPISRVSVSLLSRLLEKPEEYRDAYINLVEAMVFISIPAILLCISNGYNLVEILLGPRWIEAAPVFSWISVGGLASALYSSAFWLFVSQDRTHDLMRTTIINSVINILSFLIGAVWGITGIACFGAAGFVLLSTPYMLFKATQSGPVGRRDILRCLSPFLFCSACTYGLLYVIEKTFIAEGLITILISTFISYGCFALISLITPGGYRYIVHLKKLKAVVRSNV